MKKKSIGKKLFSFCFVALMLTSIGGSISAFANNHYDQPFSFTFPAAQTETMVTDYGDKKDTTSMWIDVRDCTLTLEVWGYGYSTQKGIVDCPYGTHYVNQGDKKYIATLVKENNFNVGGLKLYNGNRYYQYNWRAAGYWSPDSI